MKNRFSLIGKEAIQTEIDNLTKKSDKEVYLQHLRLVLFGVAAVGTIGFGIQFIFSVFTFGR